MKTSKLTVRECGAQLVKASGKTYRRIAEETGFARPNVVSMIVHGAMKLPLDRAPAFARACGGDPVHLTRLAMQEYQPNAWSVFVDALGEPLTRNEKGALALYRLICPDDRHLVSEAEVESLRQDEPSGGG